MTDVLTVPLTAPWPVWVVAVVAVAAVCWAVGRGGRQDQAKRLDAAEAALDAFGQRLDAVAPGRPVAMVGRVPVGPALPAWQTGRTATQTVVMPVTPAGSDLPSLGHGRPAVASDATLLAADHPPPAATGDPVYAAAVAAAPDAQADAAAVVAGLDVPDGRLPDLSDAYDVFGTDDGPPGPAPTVPADGGGDPDDPPPPSDPGPPPWPPIPAFHAGPRYDWASAGWNPLAPHRPPTSAGSPRGVPGRGYDSYGWLGLTLAPLRWLRWTLAGRGWRATTGAEAAALLGYDTPALDEPTTVLPVVARVPAPRNLAYRPRHDFAEVPPSLRCRAELLPVTLRCTVIARAVSPAGWRPRPTSRTGLELWARKVARRHGRRPLLGTFGPVRCLP